MKKYILVLYLLIVACGTTMGQSIYCGGNISPSSSTAFIYIYQDTPIEWNGMPLEFGSHIIVVFQNSNGDWECAGETQWWGYNTILNVRGEDSELEGYEEGETFKFYVQLPDDCVLQEVEAEFLMNTQFPAGDTYTQAGKSRLSSLSATFNPSLETTILADTCEASTGQVAIDDIFGASAANIFWSNGQEGFTANNLSAGMISAQIITEEGCTFSASFNIPALPCPLLQANATSNGFTEGDQGCAPFTVVFTDNSLSEAGIQSYFWNFGDGNTSTQASPIHTYTEPGNYTAELTIADAYQTASQIFEITVFSAPIVDWSYEPNICQPQIVTFYSESSNDINNWSWNFSDGQSADQPSTTIDFGDVGTLITGSLEVTDENNCVNEIPIEIAIPEAYDLAIMPEIVQSPTCMENNGSIEIIASGGLLPYQYAWQHDIGNTTNSASMLPPDNYIVSVTDDNGCRDSLTFTLEDNTQVPDPNLGADTSFCENEIVELNTGIALGTFQWYWNGMAIMGANSSTYFPEQSGSYVVEVSNVDNCIGLDTLIVDLFSVPFVDLGDDQSLCPSQTTILDATCEGCTYQWSDGSTTPSIEGIPNNEYVATVLSAEGCTASDTIFLSALPAPMVSLGEDQIICEGASIMIGEAEIPGSSYNWSTGAMTAQIQITNTGEYALTVTNIEGCTQSDSIEVSFLERPIASIFTSAMQICAGETLQLSADGEGDYFWIDTSSTINTLELSDITVAPAQTTVYGLIVSNECYSDTTYLSILVSQPYLSAPADTCIAFGKEVSLEAPFANTYSWQQAGQNNTLSTNPILTISPDTTTLYNLQMTDTLGCIFRDSILVTVLQLQNIQLEPVAIITPNGDGYNDVLSFNNITKFSPRTLTVFNRWGGIVYDSFDYQNDWDGTRKGEPLPAGVYYYILRIGQQELKHSLTIIRE